MKPHSLILFILAVFQVPEARSQDPAPTPRRQPADLLNAKDQAKAKRQMRIADLRELARERAEAARTVYEGWEAEVVVGRGSLHSLFDTLADWRSAQLATTDREADRRLVQDTSWMAIRCIDDITQSVYEAGRVGIRDVMLTRYNRLGADLELALTGARGKGPSRSVLPAIQADFAPDEKVSGLLNTKKLARAKFEALHADPKTLRERQLHAAQIAFHAQMMEYLAGRASSYYVERWAAHVRDAGSTLAKSDTERFAFLEDFWLTKWHDDSIQSARYEAGRIPIQDFLMTRYARIVADVALARSSAKLSSKRTLAPLASAYGNDPSTFEDVPHLKPRMYLDAKELARGKFAALRADPKEQERAKLEAARKEYEEREIEFTRGRGTYDLLVEAGRRQLDSELALAEKKSDRRIAHERYWARMQWSHDELKGWYDKGRISQRDYKAGVQVLRDAEIILLQAMPPAPR